MAALIVAAMVLWLAAAYWADTRRARPVRVPVRVTRERRR